MVTGVLHQHVRLPEDPQRLRVLQTGLQHQHVRQISHPRQTVNQTDLQLQHVRADQTFHRLVAPGVAGAAVMAEERTEVAAAAVTAEVETRVGAEVLAAEAEVVAEAGDADLFKRQIRSAHIPHTHIFTISLFKKTHIIPGVDNDAGGVNQFKITDFHYLVSVTGYKHVIGFE